ncbi:MAG: tyrosine-type recombinase/integrase [Rhodobacteraceae bacterium]|nr:tyrosine-type recombinase/integrase [Paracoccaceae bacterium]
MATILAAHAFESMSAGMDRKALEDSLKALGEELAQLEGRRRRAGLKASQLRNEVELALIDPDNPGPLDLSKWKLSQDLEFALQSADKEEAVKNAYTATLDRLNFLKGVLERDQIAVEAEKVGLHSALRTFASVSMTPASPQLSHHVPQSASEAPPATENAREITEDSLLSVAAQVVLAARREAKGEDAGPDRYQERLEASLAAFIDVIGDLPLKQYLPIHIQDFATILAQVPLNRSKYPEFKGLSLRKIVEKNGRRKPPLPHLATTTIQGSISDFLSLWNRATAGVGGVKDLKAYRITMPSAASKSIEREAIPVGNLNKWVAAAAEQKWRNAHKRWLPIVAMLTGMRLGEIVWLQVSDFVEQDGHTIIDLRKPLIIDRKEVERRLKTPDSSPRIVALPPSLIESGFVNYVREVRKRGWVFSAFHTADDPADAASKQMKNWMVTLAIHERHRQTFHSLRHNAKHWYAYHFGQRIADRQLGHKPPHIGGQYGFKVLQPEEVELIAQMPIPRGLDLTPFLSRKLDCLQTLHDDVGNGAARGLSASVLQYD